MYNGWETEAKLSVAGSQKYREGIRDAADVAKSLSSKARAISSQKHSCAICRLLFLPKQQSFSTTSFNFQEKESVGHHSTKRTSKSSEVTADSAQQQQRRHSGFILGGLYGLTFNMWDMIHTTLACQHNCPFLQLRNRSSLECCMFICGFPVWHHFESLIHTSSITEMSSKDVKHSRSNSLEK